MKNNLFLFWLISIILMSPVFAEPIEFILQPNNLTLNISETKNAALRIIHTNETNLTIPISLSYISVFPLNFSKDNFNLAIYENVDINISVPSNHLKAGNYSSTILIQTPEKIYRISLPIKLRETSNFLIESEKNFTWNQGDKGVFYLNISNAGNTDLDLPITISNSSNASKIFETTSSIHLPIGTAVSLPVFYDIPLNFSSGQYDFRIFVSNKNSTIHALIKDTTNPKIELEVPEKVYVTQKLKFNASCEDNEKVSKFYYKVENKTYNSTQPFYFNKTKEYKITFICTDNFNNSVNKTATISAISIPIQNLTKSFNVLKKKKGEIITLKLFSTPIKVRFNATLEEFNYSGKADILLKSGKHSAYLNENSTIRSSAEGDVILELSNLKNLGNYNGKLKFNFENYANESQVEIFFNGSIGEYTVREPFNLSIRGFNLKCRGVDTGSGSKVICDGFEYPSDIDPDDYVFFFTKSQIDMERKLHSQELENIKHQKNIIIYVLIIISVLLFLWGIARPFISKMIKEGGGG